MPILLLLLGKGSEWGGVRGGGGGCCFRLDYRSRLPVLLRIVITDDAIAGLIGAKAS